MTIEQCREVCTLHDDLGTKSAEVQCQLVAGHESWHKREDVYSQLCITLEWRNAEDRGRIWFRARSSSEAVAV